MELKGLTTGVIFKRCTAQLRCELRLALRKRLGFKSNRAIEGGLILL
jgi:predicted sulfurtransferase